ncbi:MAG TPA: hypothetical protein VM686_14500 [Polyangiaceae bacterium]|nr:hypothetical protein [Polyangiaceae bacterium]
MADVVGGGGGAAGSSDAAAGAAGAAGSGLPSEDSDELCADGSDNDGDGDQDCEDDDCKMSWLTACSEVCDDALDNDGDGDQDCDDRACNGENGATASPNCNVRRLQELQDGTVAAGTQVTTFPVYVTAIRDTGARHLFLQEGNGVTISPHAYPEYAGIHVFATLGESDNLGLDGLAIGDCVQLTGTLTENANSTELVSPTAFEVLGSGCGDFPQPTVVALSAIASDTDLATQGSQTGGFVENYESVLVQVQNVRVSHLGASNAFDVVTLESDQQILTVDDFFYGAAPVVDQTYTTLTGVLDQFNALYRLLPRTAADVVP